MSFDDGLALLWVAWRIERVRSSQVHFVRKKERTNQGGLFRSKYQELFFEGVDDFFLTDPCQVATNTSQDGFVLAKDERGLKAILFIRGFMRRFILTAVLDALPVVFHDLRLIGISPHSRDP